MHDITQPQKQFIKQQPRVPVPSSSSAALRKKHKCAINPRTMQAIFAMSRPRTRSPSPEIKENVYIFLSKKVVILNGVAFHRVTM